MKTHHAFLVPVIVLAAAGIAAAQGLVIPTEPDIPPLALQRHHVSVKIEHQTSSTTVEQVFANHTSRPLEAQYVFPIPKGATITRFTMLVNGKETEGEMLEKTKARAIYNSIVSRAKDPGLLECLGNDIFRANIFPIAPNGTQTITVRFDQVLPAENALVRYVYPFRAGHHRGPKVDGSFRLEVSLKSAFPIQNIYSPTHAVDVVRGNERTAKVTLRRRHARMEKDFRLYYGSGDRDVGLNLVTYRPDASKPGYFMMLASPRSGLQSERIAERDIVFAIDTSGSMSGKKIRQARAALKYCISHLNPGDRFNIVRFSTFVDQWKKELVSARDHREEALEFADTLLAEGGTDIDGALQAALSYPRDASRPYLVLFLTDGKPTSGDTTDPVQILAKLRKARAAEGGESVRIFSWGVGYDVNTRLMDSLASSGRGLSEYVRPEEDIEEKISAFYNKASHPVLTHLNFAVEGAGVKLVNTYPNPLSDLYAGSQLVLFGRYTGKGEVMLRLTGRVNEKTETFDYEGSFPDSQGGHAFIEPLWAQRRIGHLLEQIRLHGESKELVEDVIRLSKEYGIQTPYTSYLVTEGDTPVPPPPMARAERKLMNLAKKAAPGANAPHAPEPFAEEAEKARRVADSLAAGFKREGGKASVDTARYLRQLKEAEQTGGRPVRFQRAAGTRFFTYRGMWVDERFRDDHKVTEVKFGSAAYFRILERRPELVDVFKLGTAVVYVTAGKKALVVSAAGEEKLADDAIDALFAK